MARFNHSRRGQLSHLGRLSVLLSLLVLSEASTPLIDSSGSTINRIPTDLSVSSGVVGIITSPGTPSPSGIVDGGSSDTNDDLHLSLRDSNSDCILSCRGATLNAASSGERLSLGTTSLMSGAIILDGITQGDVERGLRHSRHARTLTAIFRAKIRFPSKRQLLLLGLVEGVVAPESLEKEIATEVRAIFDAVAVESTGKVSFNDMYQLQVVALQTPEDAESVLATAKEAAAAQAAQSEEEEEVSFASLLSDAQTRIKESGVASEALDSPMAAQAFLTCRQAYAKQAKTVRAKVASFQARVSRGLLVDGFGEAAESLLAKVLEGFDSETLASAGLPLVSNYRLQMRMQLQALVDTSLEELFEAQIANLEKSTLKKLSRQLLSQVSKSVESSMDDNAAAVRNAAFMFESGMDGLAIPSLGLTKDKAVREMTDKITDAVANFPDSPEAQLKRLKVVNTATSKKKKPAERAVDLGIDIVAMIRPDGFGSLQGYAGYQLGGNSITVGVANDADDPQVIAQMGGVRPPLIRIQPKLRVDVEL